jgi:DNA polymerase-3 subunit beta
MGAEGMPGIILPRKTVHELARLLESGDAAVSVGVSASKVRFEVGTVTLTSKLIDGTFPDYQRVIPKGGDKVLAIGRADLAAVVERVSVIASDRGNAVKLALAPGRVVVSSRESEGNHATDELAADYDAAPMETGFNSKYLGEMLGILDAATARIVLSDAGSPIVATGDGDAGLLYVLMPMRV